MNEIEARGLSRPKPASAGTGSAKGGGYRIKSLSGSGAREVLVRGEGGRVVSRASLSSSRSVVAGPGGWVIVVSPETRQAPGMERLLRHVVQTAQEAGVEAVEQALTAARSKRQPSAGPTEEGWKTAEAARWARRRREWLQAHPALPAAEVARLAGSETVNPSSLLQGWVRAGRVFSVQDGKKRLYPAFQLGPDGQPKPAFRTLLAVLGGRLEGWPLAVWLTGPNGEFEGWKTPLEMMERDPEAVAAAARRDIAAPAF